MYSNLFSTPFFVEQVDLSKIELEEAKLNKSFPSGHAASGFHLCTMALLFKGKWKLLSICLFSTWGTLVSLGRILQGGHFLSDVIGSLFIVTLVAVVFYPPVSRKQIIS